MALGQTEFFKMTAAGNDFIVFDNRAGGIRETDIPLLSRSLCTRALSVGADGVILLEAASDADVRARFFNPDGQATFCGNGARCAARMAYLHGMAPARMRVKTDLGLHRAEVNDSDVSFEMPDPRDFDDHVEVAALGRLHHGVFVNTGVPHFVLLESSPRDGSIEAIGQALRRHPRFAPAGVNVNFVHPVGGDVFAIRSYERGVEGETLACGTGCVAAALALVSTRAAQSPVRLRTRSAAEIRVRFEGSPARAAGVRLEGEARLVYVGHLTDEALVGFEPSR